MEENGEVVLLSNHSWRRCRTTAGDYESGEVPWAQGGEVSGEVNGEVSGEVCGEVLLSCKLVHPRHAFGWPWIPAERWRSF